MKDPEDRFMYFVGKLIVLLMFLMLIWMGVLLLDSITGEEIGIKKVDCYDREGNVIIGVQCAEIDYCTFFGFVNGQRCSEVEE